VGSSPLPSQTLNVSAEVYIGKFLNIKNKLQELNENPTLWGIFPNLSWHVIETKALGREVRHNVSTIYNTISVGDLLL
jgi:hypothetical protein